MLKNLNNYKVRKYFYIKQLCFRQDLKFIDIGMYRVVGYYDIFCILNNCFIRCQLVNIINYKFCIDIDDISILEMFIIIINYIILLMFIVSNIIGY